MMTRKKNTNPEIYRQPTQQNELRFVGISRSGNHAIINWVINQLEGRYCFLNCVEPKLNPFSTARPLSEEGKVYQTNIPAFDFGEEQGGAFSPKDYLLYSYEDCFLGMLNHSSFKENRTKWLGTSGGQKDILILRDVFNLFASRLKADLFTGHETHHGAKPISTLTVKRIYKQHANEFLGKKKFLKNPVLINFNRWSSDKAYRQSRAEELEIPFTDKGYKEVSGVAGGSSFDGLEHSGQAHKMDLQSRWKRYASEEFFWDLFDEELVELNREIFGDIEPIRYWESLKR